MKKENTCYKKKVNMSAQGNDDLEKLEFYLGAKFQFHDSILFSNLVKKQSGKELITLINALGKYEVERLYNHFHISAITENADRQREYSIELWKKWRSLFSK